MVTATTELRTFPADQPYVADGWCPRFAAMQSVVWDGFRALAAEARWSSHDTESQPSIRGKRETGTLLRSATLPFQHRHNRCWKSQRFSRRERRGRSLKTSDDQATKLRVDTNTLVSRL